MTEFPWSRAGIAILAKEPVPGLVKTRMHPFMSSVAAADLARAMATDCVSSARGTGAQVFLASNRKWSADDEHGHIRVPDVNLSSTFSALWTLRELFDRGCVTAVAVAADCPTVTGWDLENAIHQAQQRSIYVMRDSGYGLAVVATRSASVADRLLAAVQVKPWFTNGPAMAAAFGRLATSSYSFGPRRPDLDDIFALQDAYDSGALAHAPETLRSIKRNHIFEADLSDPRIKALVADARQGTSVGLERA